MNRGSEFQTAEKRGGGPVGGQIAVSVVSGGAPSCLLTESLNSAGTASRTSGLSFSRCWFSAGREGIF